MDMQRRQGDEGAAVAQRMHRTKAGGWVFCLFSIPGTGVGAALTLAPHLRCCPSPIPTSLTISGQEAGGQPQTQTLNPCLADWQVPLMAITEQLKRRFHNDRVGNVVFWVSFCFLGQPLSLILYYHDWRKMHGLI